MTTLSQYFAIHPSHPQQRLIRQAAEIIRAGGLAVIPTDTVYVLGCQAGDRKALTRVRQVRRLGDKHLLTLVCEDLSALATYARVDNTSYRVLKHYTPGPFTFILPATPEAPRLLLHPKRKTLGIRVPNHVVWQALLAELGGPMLATTMRLPDAELPVTDPEEARAALAPHVDLIIDGGPGGLEHTTVVDLTDSVPQVIRPGLGELE